MDGKCGEKWKNVAFDLKVFILHLGKRHKRSLSRRHLKKKVLQNSIGLNTE